MLIAIAVCVTITVACFVAMFRCNAVATRRRPEPTCAACGYGREGLPRLGRCPECGLYDVQLGPTRRMRDLADVVGALLCFMGVTFGLFSVLLTLGSLAV